MAADTSPADAAAPKTPHLSDPLLRPFLSPTFSAVDYLNGALPGLSVTSTSTSTPASRSARASLSSPPAASSPSSAAVPLSALSSQAQTLQSQLSAHTTRLSTLLTALADDILRSGSRLSYQVDVLRGETGALAEALLAEGSSLRRDIERFVPASGDNTTNPTATTITAAVPALQQPPNATSTPTAPSANTLAPPTTASLAAPATPLTPRTPGIGPPPLEISRLRTLSLVRHRLALVVALFGDALRWPLSPSELSLAASLISVSGPDGSISDGISPARRGRRGDDGGGGGDLEEQGRKFAEEVRAEIAALLEVEGIVGEGEEDDEEEESPARQRVEALRTLAAVWRGTSEEKARGRFVESLAKMVEDKERERERERARRGVAGKSYAAAATTTTAADKKGRTRAGSGRVAAAGGGGTKAVAGRGADKGGAGGFLEGLARLRRDLYIE